MRPTMTPFSSTFRRGERWPRPPSICTFHRRPGPTLTVRDRSVVSLPGCGRRQRNGPGRSSTVPSSHRCPKNSLVGRRPELEPGTKLPRWLAAGARHCPRLLARSTGCARKIGNLVQDSRRSKSGAHQRDSAGTWHRYRRRGYSENNRDLADVTRANMARSLKGSASFGLRMTKSYRSALECPPGREVDRDNFSARRFIFSLIISFSNVVQQRWLA
jgi:hypothetical protein